MSEGIQNISNQDIAWDGTFVGLSPTIVGEASRAMAERGEEAIPALLAALEDERRFVAAHVLLTRLAQVKHEASPTWNGLRVEIDADGSVHIDPAQRLTLARRWRAWHVAEPRPESLPPAP